MSPQTEGVTPDPGYESDSTASSHRTHRLVGASAAGRGYELTAEEGFPGAQNSRDLDDQSVLELPATTMLWFMREEG